MLDNLVINILSIDGDGHHTRSLLSLIITATLYLNQGLYYSYYKTLVNADSLTTGILTLASDNVTEYPSTINTLARFNLVPEVWV